ncbi:MAG: DUF983 domain-containing protein [Alphaproteobacteria bacterium]|nr:DUF983 domain-containing protein [Alphaproteobacteria bacterium]
MPDPVSYPRVPPGQAGRRCRCPRCGKGSLYDGLLTVAKKCTVCDLDLSPHDTGDGASVFVIFLLGGLVVPMALKFEAVFEPPIWAHLVLWPPVIIALAIAFLRPVKATLIAYHFKNLRHKYDE